MKYSTATIQQANEVMKAAGEVFPAYKKTSPETKALFLESIANEIEALGDALILKAAEETNIPSARLIGERGRTAMQLRTNAAMVREGSWVEASIDTAVPDRKPAPKPDIRKMLVPLGPVIVFGASNFPFAYSTAGGDTASALAAGCPVVIKAHPAHAETSQMVYECMKRALATCNLPGDIVQHVFGGNEVGKALIQHPAAAAVGFTGSFTGGTALVEYARERKNPIPVFSEMGSVNPVIFLPDTLEKNAASLATAFAGSVTLGMGQFCTNPGLLLAIESESLDKFVHLLGEEVSQVKPAKMLNAGIHKTYFERMEKALSQNGVKHESADIPVAEMEALPNIASVDGSVFLENQLLHEEVFGPYSLMVRCRDIEELKNCWKAVRGQLTTSLIGTEKDFEQHQEFVELAQEIAGRIVFNGVPTGVEVCPSMVHGGPFPATTDSRFTAVGINAVKRWVRPVCFQSCPEYLLPEELKNDNPRNIWRQVNNEWSREEL